MELDDLLKLVEAEMLKTYTETVVDHATDPRNVGTLENPDGYARITGPCGDTMEIWIRMREGKISQASFRTDGCGPSIACGSIATEMAKGKTPGEALTISQAKVLEALGGLPEESVHCALLASNTLKAAVNDYLSSKSEPWKAAYRRNR